MKSPLTAAILILATASAGAQLSLDKSGGAAPGTTVLGLAGPAGAPYVVLYSLYEQSTSVAGITLDIPLDNAAISLSLPGFVGYLNGQGAATPAFPLPDDPLVLASVISMQAVAGYGPFDVSNLIRVTPQTPGTFKPALSDPSVPILGGAVAPAGPGSVLFCGGSGPVAQSYDSRTETWELAGATFGIGLLGQSTGLPDGRILFTGGLGLDGQPTSAAAIYDPATGTTTEIAMLTARAGHGASVMGNGQVLITGGFQNFNLADPLAFLMGISNSTEVFNPATGIFTAGPTLLEARALHTSTSVSSGQVLIAGGLSIIPIINLPTVSATAYRYNPSTGSFGLPILMNGGRFFHSAVGLTNGKVLLVGGLTLDLTQFLTTFDPTTIVVGTRTDCQVYSSGFLGGSFATVNGMQEGRAGAGVAALPGGKALICGGFNLDVNVTNQVFTTGTTASADVFTTSGSGGTIAPTGSMAAARFLPVSANLPDGTVMVLGGGPLGAEIYQP